MDEKMRAATDVAGLVGYQAELKEKINAVSRRSLDGSVVMSGEEWNRIVELVEKLLTAAPQPEPDVSALVDALDWYSQQVLGCRKATSEGEQYRTALDRDGGARARAALATYRKGGE